MTISIPELEQMLKDVIDAVAAGDPDPVGLDPERRARWRELRREVTAIRRAGGIVDIPTELP